MADDSKETSILFIDGKAIAHSTDRRELIEKAYKIVGDIDDGYPYYSSRTCSLDDFAKCLDWHAGVGWLRNATRVSDGSEVWVEILERTWYIHELTDELIPVAYAYCEENGIEIQRD